MSKKLKKHRPTRWMTVTTSGTLTFGWKCRCGIATMRFASRERREETLTDHIS